MSAALAPRVLAALAELRSDYERELPTRLAHLAEAVRDARRGEAPLRAAITEAHRLHGTAGSLGLRALSDASRELERALEAVEGATRSGLGPDDAWIAALRLLGVAEAAAPAPRAH